MISTRGLIRSITVTGLLVIPLLTTAQTVRVAVISQSVNKWPMWVAMEKGFFTEEGVDVDLTITGDSRPQLHGLESGRFDIAHEAADHFVHAVENGIDFVAVHTITRPTHDLLVRPGIESYADLHSKTIALDKLTTGYWLLYKRVLMKYGLEPGDYDLQPDSGGPANRLQAVRENRAQFTYMNPPASIAAELEGFSRLTNLSEHFPDFPASSIGTRRAWAEDHRALLVAYLRAYIRATEWLFEPDNREEALAIAAKVSGHDLVTLPGSYDVFVGHGMVRYGTLNRNGYRQVVELLIETGVIDSGGGMEKYADPSYQQEVLRRTRH